MSRSSRHLTFRYNLSTTVWIFRAILQGRTEWLSRLPKFKFSCSTGEMVQKRASRYILLVNIALTVPAMLTACFLGTWSDEKGRKGPMIVTSIGSSLASLTFLLAIYWNLPIYVFMIGKLCLGAKSSHIDVSHLFSIKPKINLLLKILTFMTVKIRENLYINIFFLIKLAMSNWFYKKCLNYITRSRS